MLFQPFHHTMICYSWHHDMETDFYFTHSYFSCPYYLADQVDGSYSVQCWTPNTICCFSVYVFYGPINVLLANLPLHPLFKFIR